MIGLSRDSVQVVAYQPEWAESFRREAVRLRSALGSAVSQIQHVGSTSVPGMIAKPIIDMIAAVERLASASTLVPVLERLGYEHRPGNPVPGRLFFALGPRTHRTHHLSLAEVDSSFWHEHIAFRDCLLAYRRVAEEYASLKKRLAAQFRRDRPSYTAAKEEFIRHTLSMRGKRPTADSENPAMTLQLPIDIHPAPGL
jgi:GrpB-like predicted nucleotidyltransferase (UPF0157 family)